MTLQKQDQKAEPQAELEPISEVSLSEVSLNYLNSIEDSLAVLTSHLTNKEMPEAFETLSAIQEETSELRSILLLQEKANVISD